MLQALSGISFLPYQVSVMIYPEHGVTDQYWIPWWIILIAILAGVLLLALLVLMLWKVIHQISNGLSLLFHCVFCLFIQL